MIPARMPILALIIVALMFPTLRAHASPANAAPPIKPALVYILTGDSDGAFIDSARAGARKAKNELKIHAREYRLRGRDDIAGTLKNLADKGFSPIIAVGYQNVMTVLNMAERYPNTKFTVIDGLVPPLFANVQSVIFKDHEGAFLVGMIAAYTTKTKHIGFIGGVDIPLIRNFAHGFKQGIAYVDPSIKLTVDMVGKNSAAWGNAERAEAIAKKQYAEGADVIFAAAGGAGLGVLRAAEDANRLAIGVDVNQNGLHPGYVLTSLVKRVDIAVYETLKTSQQGEWSPGIKYLGLKEGTLDYAVDANNRTLITETIVDKVSAARERIINGIIDVEMYAPR